MNVVAREAGGADWKLLRDRWADARWPMLGCQNGELWIVIQRDAGTWTWNTRNGKGCDWEAVCEDSRVTQGHT